MTTSISKAIACDFVRQEMGGKYSILGIYPNNAVVISEINSPVHLSFYIEILSDETRVVPIELQIKNSFGLVANRSNLNLTISGLLTAPITWGPVPISVQSPGLISCGFWLDGIWMHAINVNIMLNR
jgi:hypothetical protein